MISLKSALVCVLLLNVVLAETRINQILQKALRTKRDMENYRQLSSYGSSYQAPQSNRGPAVGRQSPQSYDPPKSYVAPPVQQAYVAPPVQQQAYVAPPVRSAYVAPPVQQAYVAPPVQASYEQPSYEQESYEQPQVQQAYVAAPVRSAYVAPPVQQAYVAPQVQSAYVAPPVQASYVAPPVQSAYVAPPVQQAYAQPASGYAQSNYNDQGYGLSPLQSFYGSAPAIQQLIQHAVNQYPGGALSSSYELQNSCSLGYTQPIYQSNQVSETYCRCPSGTYGFTCAENFINPCADGVTQYAPADTRVPPNYFIQCSWGIPYLNKCPPGTDQWSQVLLTCIESSSYVAEPYASQASYAPQAPQSSYGQSSYGNVGY